MTTKHKLAGVILASLAVSGVAVAQLAFTKAQVGDRIRKVEDGVDEFRDWAEKRADTGKAKAESAPASERTRGKKATESQKATAHDKKDELEDALSDLNKSTNRLRRKFDPSDKWMETEPQVENVMDDARRDQPGPDPRQIRHTGGALLGRAEGEHQRPGALLQRDPVGEVTPVVATALTHKERRMRRQNLFAASGVAIILSGVIACSAPPAPQQQAAAPAAKSADGLDRTVLPIPEPDYPAVTEVDARNATAPPRFEVKAPKGAPNVVIVLLDDIGFGHSSPFGGPINMPTLQALADAGLRFNRFHTTALCSPTRTALLTGRNHHVNNAGAIMELATAFQGNTGVRPQSVAPWPTSCA